VKARRVRDLAKPPARLTSLMPLERRLWSAVAPILVSTGQLAPRGEIAFRTLVWCAASYFEAYDHVRSAGAAALAGDRKRLVSYRALLLVMCADWRLADRDANPFALDSVDGAMRDMGLHRTFAVHYRPLLDACSAATSAVTGGLPHVSQ
jgi:hypothetical protein